MWVSGPASSELVALLRQRFSVDDEQGRALAGGARVRVGAALADAAAQHLCLELERLGLGAAIEPHAPAGEEILSLDEVSAVELQAGEEAAAANVDLAFKLVSLDGEERPIAPDTPTASRLPPPMSEALPLDDARFGPPTEADLPTELQLDAPAPRQSIAPRPVVEPELLLAREAPRPEPIAPAPAPSAVTGWRGELRARPPLRIGAGVVLALLAGFALSQPYANRAERRVAELRAEADRERYMNAEEAQRRVAALDEQSDAQATRAAVGVGAIWLLVGAASFAAWWKLT